MAPDPGRPGRALLREAAGRGEQLQRLYAFIDVLHFASADEDALKRWAREHYAANFDERGWEEVLVEQK